MRRWGEIMSINRVLYKVINNQSVHINFPPIHFQPTPIDGENSFPKTFWSDFGFLIGPVFGFEKCSRIPKATKVYQRALFD